MVPTAREHSPPIAPLSMHLSLELPHPKENFGNLFLQKFILWVGKSNFDLN
jgi:hypothetical protein